MIPGRMGSVDLRRFSIWRWESPQWCRLLVDDMIDGLICNTLKDWREKLTLIMEDKMLLQKLSMNTRDKIVKRYSVNSNKDNFLSLFEL